MKKVSIFKSKELLMGIAIVVIIALIVLLTALYILKGIKRDKFESVSNSIVSTIESTCNTQKSKGEVLTTTYVFKDGEVSPTLNISFDLQLNGTVLVDSNCNTEVYIQNKSFSALKESSQKTVMIEDGIAENIVYDNGTVVYYNPVIGSECTVVDYENNINSSENGNKSGCMKWYTFNDGGTSSLVVNMILDHNTTALVAWNTSGSNVSGMKEVASALVSDTSSWVTGLNQRLITANEVATIAGNNEWETSGEYFYLDTKTKDASKTCTSDNTTTCKYGWLYDRTATTCTANGCLNNSTTSTYGYWTSTPAVTAANAWYVNRFGALYSNSVSNAVGYGVRPVITVLKSSIS